MWGWGVILFKSEFNNFLEKFWDVSGKASRALFFCNDLQQKVASLEREITELKERQQRHRQALNSIKRDLLLNSNVFVTEERERE